MATNVSAEALDESLENASQFWLISSAARKLSAAHFKVIIKHWKKVSVGDACGCECACKGVHVLLFDLLVCMESGTVMAMHLVW